MVMCLVGAPGALGGLRIWFGAGVLVIFT